MPERDLSREMTVTPLRLKVRAELPLTETSEAPAGRGNSSSLSLFSRFRVIFTVTRQLPSVPTVEYTDTDWAEDAAKAGSVRETRHRKTRITRNAFRIMSTSYSENREKFHLILP